MLSRVTHASRYEYTQTDTPGSTPFAAPLFCTFNPQASGEHLSTRHWYSTLRTQEQIFNDSLGHLECQASSICLMQTLPYLT